MVIEQPIRAVNQPILAALTVARNRRSHTTVPPVYRPGLHGVSCPSCTLGLAQDNGEWWTDPSSWTNPGALINYDWGAQIDTGQIVGDVVDAGTTYLQNLAANVNNKNDANTLIAAQNRAGADMDAITAQYVNLKNSGQLTGCIIASFQKAMSTVAQRFAQYASQLTWDASRASAGIATINYWANLSIQNMQHDLTALGLQACGGSTSGTITLPSGGSVPINTGSSGQIISGVSNTTLVIGAGVLLVLLMKRR